MQRQLLGGTRGLWNRMEKQVTKYSQWTLPIPIVDSTVEYSIGNYRSVREDFMILRKMT